jgi:translation initiation factor 1
MNGVSMAKQTKNAGLVYSTDAGRICPKCSRPVASCQCKKQQQAAVQGDGKVRISRSTKGRKGKGVTLITGLAMPPDELKALAKELKQKCGTGGTVKQGVIEIQGDHQELLKELLKGQA